MITRVGLLYKQPQILTEVQKQLPGFDVVDLSAWTVPEGATAHYSKEELVAQLRQFDVLVTSLTTPPLPLELATKGGRLQYICHTRGMLRPYFSAKFLKAGIRLSNWGDERSWIVADKVVALILHLIIQISGLDYLSKTGKEVRIPIAYPENIDGFRLGLYGCGAIGRLVASKTLALGMKVSVYDPFASTLPDGAERVNDLNDLFAQNYAVSVHAGSCDATKGSVNAERLALLPQGGIIINSARGGLIDEPALLAELRSKRLMAALDVLSDESSWESSPFAQLTNCILTKHGIRLPGYKAPNFILPDYVVHNITHFRQSTLLRNEIVTTEQFNRLT